jgi:hypothetical protein
MSHPATNWVWKHSRAEGNARLVFLAIADRADKYGARCWPSQGWIAERCRISERTVRRAVTELEELGELRVNKYGGPPIDGQPGRRTHSYELPALTDNLTAIDAGQDDHQPAEVAGQNERVAGQNGSGCRTPVSGEPSYPLLKPSSLTDREREERKRLAKWVFGQCKPVHGRRASLDSCRKLIDRACDELGHSLYDVEQIIGKAITVHGAYTLQFFKGAFEEPPASGPSIHDRVRDYDQANRHLTERSSEAADWWRDCRDVPA